MHNGKFAAEAMISNEGEVVQFLKQVYLEGAVEYYLREIGKFCSALNTICALVVQYTLIIGFFFTMKEG